MFKFGPVFNKLKQYTVVLFTFNHHSPKVVVTEQSLHFNIWMSMRDKGNAPPITDVWTDSDHKKLIKFLALSCPSWKGRKSRYLYETLERKVSLACCVVHRSRLDR